MKSISKLVGEFRNGYPLYFFFKGIICLLYTSDAADERSSVDLGGRRILKKKTSVTVDSRGSLLMTKKKPRVMK